MSALLMDSTLRYLYVEGTSDRHFFNWLIGDTCNCEIQEISWVNINVDKGGNRARAVWLADYARTNSGTFGVILERLRVLVDADHDHIDGVEAVPPLVITDGRCLESYFLRADSFEKIFVLALQVENVDHAAIFAATVDVCLKLAAIREIDRRDCLQLPFQRQQIRKFLNVNTFLLPSLRLSNLIAKLVRDAGLPHAVSSQILCDVATKVTDLESLDPERIVHGHDFECVLGEILQKKKFSRDGASVLLRSTFERSHVPQYLALAFIVEFASS